MRRTATARAPGLKSSATPTPVPGPATSHDPAAVRRAGGLGLCKALFGKDNLVPPTWSVTWTVVDPLIVALPLSALTLIIVMLITKPMNKSYADYCFGGAKPDGK